MAHLYHSPHSSRLALAPSVHTSGKGLLETFLRVVLLISQGNWVKWMLITILFVVDEHITPRLERLSGGGEISSMRFDSRAWALHQFTREDPGFRVAKYPQWPPPPDDQSMGSSQAPPVPAGKIGSRSSRRLTPMGGLVGGGGGWGSGTEHV